MMAILKMTMTMENDHLPRFVVLDYDVEVTTEVAKAILNSARVKYLQYCPKGELTFATVDHIKFSPKVAKYVVPLVCRSDANNPGLIREIILAINMINGTVYIDSKYSNVFSKLVNLYHLTNF